ncbi:MAG: GntR family transcriptional regulator [Comamonadaceae bacterium]|nr:MAG: GntR family transcriptional regulator [Comamonadaceae bacterium]
MSKKPTAQAELPEDRMYQRMVSAIIEKSLRPGEHVNEMQLAEAYSISRPRVRRVLERLQMEDVLEFQRNRGAFISRPSVQEALDVFEARVHLEAVVLRLACQRATASDIARLRAHNALERKAFDSGLANVNEVAGDFHVLLAEVAGNKVILETIKLLIRRVCLIQSLYETNRAVLCLVDEHEKLVDLIEARDPENCVTSSNHHCSHILSSLHLSDERKSKRNIYSADA